MSKEYLPVTIENLIEVFINQGIKSTDLPEIFGFSSGKLISIMNKNGIDASQRKIKPQPLENFKEFESRGESVFKTNIKPEPLVQNVIPRDEVFDLYITQNLSLKTCANHYGITKERFRQILSDFDITKTDEAKEKARKEGMSKLYSDPERIEEMVKKAQSTIKERYGKNWYYNHASKEELEVFEFVKECLSETVEVINGDYSVISRPGSGGAMQLDIHIPSLKLAIEYNGIRWHDREAYLRDVADGTESSREALKERLCKDLGICLLHVWSDEWMKNRVETEDAIREFLSSHN